MEKCIDFELMVGQHRLLTVLECAEAKNIHICKSSTAELRQKEIN